MTNISKSTLILIVSVVLLLGLLGSTFGIRYFLKTKALEVGGTTQEVARYSLSREEEKNLANKLNELKSAQDSIENFVISEEKIVEFIEDLENLGDQARVRILIDRVSEEGPLSLSVKTSGDFAKLYQFLSLIESFSYPTVVETVSFDLVTTEGGTKTWDMDLTIRLLGILTNSPTE